MKSDPSSFLSVREMAVLCLQILKLRNQEWRMTSFSFFTSMTFGSCVSKDTFVVLKGMLWNFPHYSVIHISSVQNMSILQQISELFILNSYIIYCMENIQIKNISWSLFLPFPLYVFLPPLLPKSLPLFLLSVPSMSMVSREW